MSYTRDVVILTKSAKHGGNCVAGIDIKTGEWVRPIKKSGPISNEDMRCDNGMYCTPLDVVRITFVSKSPNGCQTENEEIDISHKWVYLDIMSIYDVLKIHPAENYQNIFGNYSYIVSDNEINKIKHSLILIHVTNLNFYKTENSEGKPKTKANFKIIKNSISFKQQLTYMRKLFKKWG